ncbi:deoxyribodipyrimidine photo-lyase [Rubripirellula reticaptiva]|uniref:Deoxyribodipyrimidine photo-lyase n=1 Tax=Rubripirellula reticaptiva TaxID=2528013 RepID=A0A5C6FAT2_9BACT|nr:deoxyribodipyrimidine photo-lyase [Rubripirellula reticaptiva]TWU57647.1 Deoxyribodipyrimidine photo-lyase [Rubripirellula reticaptiva]
MRSLVWFRRDLRVTDNSALAHAAERSTDGVVGLFILTPGQWRLHDDADAKVHFWLQNLQSLSQSLAALNIPLRVVSCDKFDQVPKLVCQSVSQFGCGDVYFNAEYEVNERSRDAQVTDALQSQSIQVHASDDRVIVRPGKIKTKEDRPYQVFTPYRRVWDTLACDDMTPLAIPPKQPKVDLKASKIPTELAGFDFSAARPDLWPAGEAEVDKRLAKFKAKIGSYGTDRDIPSISGTSQLSPYLAAGVVSPRQCLAVAIGRRNGSFTIPSATGPATWVSELTWRDFYTDVMVNAPRVSMHQPFKRSTNKIRWRDDPDDFAAWCEGRTGYPIVDAGMRQLNQTGWMHNRLRMVTAMFLTKHLLIDWRWGEKYFMQKLIDGDLAANNGGWQWSASTGTDSVPYFRIFNPFSQSKRFDPDGKYITRFCPELGNVPAKALHDSKKLADSVGDPTMNYPQCIVDHKFARQRALDEFKRIGDAH